MKMLTKTLILILLAAGLTMGTASGDEHAALKAKFLENIQVEIEPLKTDALGEVFQQPVYQFEVQLFETESVLFGQSRDFTAYETGDGVAQILVPSTNEELPWLMTLIDPGFRLSEETAPQMEAALRAVMPERFFEMDHDDEVIVALPGEWRFVTGTFFDNLKGFILTVNDDGQVTGAVYSLNIEKE